MEPTKLHSYKVRNISNLHIYGRTSDYRDALPLFWTGSGFSVDTRSGELWALLESDYSIHEPWVSVWINGKMVSRFIAEKGRRWYCLFRGLNPDSIHRFTLLKETQAMSPDPKHLLLVHALGVPESMEGPADRIFVKQNRRPLNIEFVGDSLTTGEGLAGDVPEMDWISGWMSLRDNYAVTTAMNLDADFHILSQSGWGVTTSWDNDRNSNLPRHYRNVCSIAGGKNEEMGSHDLWDFSKWKSDVIVVNLGTNDWVAFNNPPKIDEETGAEWKYRLDEDGRPFAEDVDKIKAGVSNFLSDLRENNPDSLILWGYGMCGFELGEAIKETLDLYVQAHGDTRLHFIPLPSMEEETEEDDRGSRQHPGPCTHRKAARILTGKIKELLGIN